MKIIVWHHNHKLAEARGLEQEHRALFAFGRNAVELWSAGCYTPVAIVETDHLAVGPALERAYELTNSIKRPWFERANKPRALEPLVEAARSTMVGDVFEVISEGGPNVPSSKWACSMVGFKPLGVV